MNFDGCKNVLINFRQWGEAVGSKLEELDESDQEKTKEEEPVLSRETSKGNNYYLFESRQCRHSRGNCIEVP